MVAATHRDLPDMVRRGAFREDLFYRLAVVVLPVPALRERREDIPTLVAHFLARAPGAKVEIDRKAMARLVAAPWPGNVRQLENAVERAVALCDADRIDADDLPETTKEARAADFLVAAAERMLTIGELERAYATLVLERVGGNKLRAASLLGVDRRTLQRWFSEPPGEPDGA